MSRSPGRDDPNPCIMPRERNRWIRRWTRDTLNGPADLGTNVRFVHRLSAIGERETYGGSLFEKRKSRAGVGNSFYGPRKWQKSIGIPTTRGVAILGQKIGRNCGTKFLLGEASFSRKSIAKVTLTLQPNVLTFNADFYENELL